MRYNGQCALIERWGKQVAEIQVRYDSARLLQSLEREIGLARQMARSQALLALARTPDDPLIKAATIGEGRFVTVAVWMQSWRLRSSAPVGKIPVLALCGWISTTSR